MPGTDRDGEYVNVEMDEARCPECGNEEGNTRTETNGSVQPVPPEHKGGCPECDHSDHPLAFHHAYKWERMSEEERQEAREYRERMEDKMADYEHSAHGISMRREP